MIIISSREGFENPEQMSNKLLIKEDHNAENWKLLEEVDLRKILGCQNSSSVKVLVLVHGYNNKQSEIYSAYELIQSELNKTYDHVIGYAWPGGSSFIDWWDAKGMADEVACQFGHLIEALNGINVSPDLMSHSLGARVCLQALKTSDVSVGKYFCLAASVDGRCFRKEGISLPDIPDFLEGSQGFERELKLRELEKQAFSSSVSRCRHVVVLHSKHDAVLKRLYTWIEGHMALGVWGPPIRDRATK